MESDYLTAFLDRKKTPIIKKKRHTYLAYHVSWIGGSVHLCIKERGR